MKRFTAVFAAVLIVCSLGACSASSGSGGSADSQYLAAINSSSSDFAGIPDADLIELGHAACDDFAAGDSLNQVASDYNGAINKIGPNSGITIADGGILAGAGVNAYCPQYDNQIQGG